MEAAPCPIPISDDADEILGRPAFPFIKQPVDLDLVVLSVFELGFGAQAARTDVALGASAEVSLRDIYARAVSLGFELSPAEVGPVLRLQYLDQPHGEEPGGDADGQVHEEDPVPVDGLGQHATGEQPDRTAG